MFSSTVLAFFSLSVDLSKSKFQFIVSSSDGLTAAEFCVILFSNFNLECKLVQEIRKKKWFRISGQNFDRQSERTDGEKSLQIKCDLNHLLISFEFLRKSKYV